MQTSRQDLPTSCPAPNGVTVIEDMINFNTKRSNPNFQCFIFTATNKFKTENQIF